MWYITNLSIKVAHYHIPKVLQVIKDFDCTLFFFGIVIPNTMRCIVTGHPLLARKPPSFSLRRAVLTGVHTGEGNNVAFFKKLCNQIF